MTSLLINQESAWQLWALDLSHAEIQNIQKAIRVTGLKITVMNIIRVILFIRNC